MYINQTLKMNFDEIEQSGKTLNIGKPIVGTE